MYIKTKKNSDTRKYCCNYPNIWTWTMRFEPVHETLALFVLRKFNLQTHMHSHPVGLDVWFLVRHFFYFHTSRVRQWRLWPDCANVICDKYHNLMSWLILPSKICRQNGKQCRPGSVWSGSTLFFPDLSGKPRFIAVICVLFWPKQSIINMNTIFKKS